MTVESRLPDSTIGVLAERNHRMGTARPWMGDWGPVSAIRVLPTAFAKLLPIRGSRQRSPSAGEVRPGAAWSGTEADGGRVILRG